jgi:signal transduction histidine kinase/CheY-like chemotaxis protein
MSEHDLRQIHAELRRREEELVRLNKELEDTNRGVVALYAELDEKADFLQRASEIKTRFLSNMSHEFRTPLNSILSLSRMLLDRLDGDLTAEQEKQVGFIRKAAENLSDLVNDLLDLAKVEAGKLVVRPTEFTVHDLFSALRGMLRPLLAQNAAVALVFDEPGELPPLHTDEGKLSQILRNLISNALKFTEQGEVRVAAQREDEHVTFTVRDTGIGIATENRERIFEEFVQIENPLQKRYKGTGLGLPLSRRLAQLLGGGLQVESAPGQGSTFTVALPFIYRGREEDARIPELSRVLDPARLPVLAVEDNRETLLVYDRFLKDSGFQLVPATSVAEARRTLQHVRPMAIVMDILLEGENTWGLLEEIKTAEATRALPVFVVTMVDNARKARAVGADDFCIKPMERDWLLSRLRAAAPSQATPKILIVDDDEIARYVLRGLLPKGPYEVIEAGGGEEGLARARHERPRAIFLDLAMPGLSGFDVFDALRADPATQAIPVIVVTSRPLTEHDRARLAGAAAILSKGTNSRESMAEALRQAGLEVREP